MLNAGWPAPRIEHALNFVDCPVKDYGFDNPRTIRGWHHPKDPCQRHQAKKPVVLTLSADAVSFMQSNAEPVIDSRVWVEALAPI